MQPSYLTYDLNSKLYPELVHQTSNLFVLPQLSSLMRKKQKWNYWIVFFIFCKGNVFNL